MQQTHTTKTVAAQTTEELELLETMISGHAQSWNRFQKQYGALVQCCVRKVLCRFPSLMSFTDVEDVVAEFYASVLTDRCGKLRAFDPQKGVKLSTWIGLLATRSAWDAVRRERRRVELKTHLGEILVDSMDLGPENALMQREMVRVVFDIFGTFTERDQDFIASYFLDEQEPEQIAESMAISTKTIYTKKHKILHRLEEQLEEMQYAA